MNLSFLKNYTLKTGMSIKELTQTWGDATEEAKAVGKGDDTKYITEIFEELLELDENTHIPKMALKFAEFDLSLDEYLEMLTSGDIPADVRPEIPPQKPIDDPEDIIEEDLLLKKKDNEEEEEDKNEMKEYTSIFRKVHNV